MTMEFAVVGEALIDFIADGKGAYHPHLGGSPYNLAIGLARQGVRVSYLSPLSDDQFGHQLRESLLAEGVVLPLARQSEWPTSLALVSLDNAGQASYRFYREGIADKDTDYTELKESLPARTRLLHTGSLAITPSQLPKIQKLFKHLKERDILISIDVNIRRRASIDNVKYINGVRSLLPWADIVKASDEDLMALGMAEDLASSVELAVSEMGEGVFLLTLGDGGVQAYGACGRVDCSAFVAERVVDTVGAGDSFHAAFLASLLDDPSTSDAKSLLAADQDRLRAALRYSCAAAAINVSRRGCNPASRAEVLAYLSNRLEA